MEEIINDYNLSVKSKEMFEDAVDASPCEAILQQENLDALGDDVLAVCHYQRLGTNEYVATMVITEEGTYHLLPEDESDRLSVEDFNELFYGA